MPDGPKLRIETLIEDKSGTVLLRHILQKYFQERQDRLAYELYLRPHKGLGKPPPAGRVTPNKHSYGLMHLLPAKLRAYQRTFDPRHTLLIVVLDADREDPSTVFGELADTLHQYAPDLKAAIGIAVEEMEAWLMGDFSAIKRAYPEADKGRYLRYQQDAICGTWEFLAEVILGPNAAALIRAGYPAVGTYKTTWAESIAPHLSLAGNRSPSLKRFLNAMDRVIERMSVSEEEASYAFY